MIDENMEIPEGFKMTELGMLPEEWEVEKITNKCEIKSSSITLSKLPLLDTKEYDAFTVHGIKVSDMNLPGNEYNITKANIEVKLPKELAKKKTVPAFSLVFPKRGAAIATNKKRLTTTWTVLDPNLIAVVPGVAVNPIFLFYWFLTFDISSIQTPGPTPQLNKKDVEPIQIPLPPLFEQKKIAAVLSAVQEAKEKTESVISAAKELKKSLMKHLFTYGPVSLQETEKVKLKDTEIGPIPEEWEVKTLGEIGEFQYGYTETASNEEIGPQFLRITDIDLTKSTVNWSNVPYCKILESKYAKYSLCKGDILIARIGATTGKTCIIKNAPKSVFASYLIRFTSDQEIGNPLFIYYFSTSEKYWNEINACKGGKLKQGINAPQLKKIKMPIPTMQAQKQITTILSSVDQKIEAEESKKAALEELFKTLLNNLMMAKIRVNHLEIAI